MKNLIPKPIKAAKYRFWRNLTITDFLIISVWVALTIMFIFGFQWSLWIKMLSAASVVLVSLPLIIRNNKTKLKGWQFVYYKLNYLFSTKKYKKNKLNDTKLLVPFHQALDITTVKAQKELIAVFEVKGFDLTLLSEEEQSLRLRDLQDVFKYCNFSITLMKLELPLNFDITIKYQKNKLAKMSRVLKDKKIKQFKSSTQQIKANINFLQNDLVNNSDGLKTEKRFFAFLYDKNHQNLEEKMAFLENKMLSGRFICERLTSFEIVKILKLLWNPYEKPIDKKEFDLNKLNLAELLRFNEIKFKNNYFKANNIFYAIKTIDEYPLFINDLWGACLFSNEQTVIWNIHPLNSEDTKKALNSAINTTQTRQVLTKSHININENNYELNIYQNLIDKINSGGEILKNINIMFLCYGNTKKALERSELILNKSLVELDIKVDSLWFRQFDALKSFLPYNNDLLMKKMGREMPTSTLASAFPFINSGLTDEKGMFFGTTNMSNNIMWDQFILTNRRVNHNLMIIGTSGSGKSFFIKKLINYHVSMGRKVIVIDPEREYTNLCKYYAGNWVDTGNASKGKINPLQILNNNFTDNKKSPENTSSVSNHLVFLTQWFKTLYPDFTDREFNLLIKFLKKLYQNFGITNQINVNKLTNNKFPIIKDLYDLLVKEFELNPNNLLREFIDLISTDFLNDGKYENLWNGYTTLTLDNNFTVYDVFDLFDKEDKKIGAAQLYLMLAVIKKEIKENRFKTKNEIVVIVDEAHLAIDKDNPVALDFMYQMVKRIRKYKGALVTATQNISDFVGNDEIMKKTTAIINNTQYSLIMGLKQKDLTDVTELYRSYGGLTAAETDFISRAKQGQGLFFVSGFERYLADIKATNEEIKGF